MASEKETIPKDDKKEDEPAKDTNGEKNGVASETASAPAAEKQKLSLGEIAAVDGEIAKAKTEQLQVLHNLFYGKNGSGPQIKRGIRKFAGFDEADKQKKLDLLLTYELPAIKQTATILDLQDIKKDDVKDVLAKAIVEFLMTPSGKTFEEVQKDEPAEEEEPSELEEEEEEEEIKVKPKKGRGGANSAARPKRATASRVWTNDYGSSEEEEIEEARPRVGRKKRGDNSDSGSDYNPSGAGSDSEADRRKSARNALPARPTRGGRGRRGRDSESDEESEEESEDGSEEEVMPAKKKKASPPNRATPKRGAAQKGRKRKLETESEEEVSEEEEVESEDSEKQKKSPRKAVTPKSAPQKKNSKGRPAKRAAPPAAKKKQKEVSSDEEEPEEDASEDDEPLKKSPTKKGGSVDGTPTDDDIKKLLKDILAEANLEEITMKTVCKKVYAHYPNHDLSQRKDFIKQTVKSLIAA